MKVESGKKVRLHYKGMLKDGTVFDSSEGGEPLEFTVGAGEIIPGFEKNIMGMDVGEKKTFTVTAEEAYGPRNEAFVVEVSRKNFGDAELGEGMILELEDEHGHVFNAVVKKVTEEAVVLDLNHPLAGEDLTFEVEIVGVGEKDEKNE